MDGVEEGLWKPVSGFSVTVCLIILTCIAYLMQYIVGTEAFFGKFALQGSYVFGNEEYYRLITYMFAHGGIAHLFFNMLNLYFFGNAVEHFFGGVKLAVLYFLSGIVGGIGSIIYSFMEMMSFFTANGINVEFSTAIKYSELWNYSVGASGAILGVSGAFVIIAVCSRNSRMNISPARLVIFILLSLFGGASDSGIDHGAHIFGFIAGSIISFIYIVIIRRKLDSEDDYAD
ncbi:MAG: rhomboid family intramembrane serine protease [Lachnospiraceae bacterium]|nr:rhomboid family intramembrane serine protease [Lachnospiraceae bacterium]